MPYLVAPEDDLLDALDREVAELLKQGGGFGELPLTWSCGNGSTRGGTRVQVGLGRRSNSLLEGLAELDNSVYALFSCVYRFLRNLNLGSARLQLPDLLCQHLVHQVVRKLSDRLNEPDLVVLGNKRIA